MTNKRKVNLEEGATPENYYILQQEYINLLEAYEEVSHECSVLTTYLVVKHPDTAREITKEFGFEFPNVDEELKKLKIWLSKVK